MGGGGVDGAIHRAGGPEILAACRRLRAERFPDGLPTGQAAATTAGELPACWVIHTVGPNLHAGEDDPATEHVTRELVRDATRSYARYWLEAKRPVDKQTAVDTTVALLWGGLSHFPRQTASVDAQPVVEPSVADAQPDATGAGSEASGPNVNGTA